MKLGNSYGIARALIALNTLLTLLANPAGMLFKQADGRHDGTTVSIPIMRFNLFELAGPQLGTLVALAVLGLVLAGWRPRITGIFHWWVSISFYTGATVVDGGDQAASILTMLLIPITLADSRRWHWQQAACGPYQSVLIETTHTALRVQVAFIYLQAFIGKLAVPEWLDGTAMYYFMNDPVFGVQYTWLRRLAEPVVFSAAGAFLFTWLPLLLELALAYALVVPTRYRSRLLALGLFFHFATALFFGIVSFFLCMSGVLVLYLVPLERHLPLRDCLMPLRAGACLFQNAKVRWPSLAPRRSGS